MQSAPSPPEETPLDEDAEPPPDPPIPAIPDEVLLLLDAPVGSPPIPLDVVEELVDDADDEVSVPYSSMVQATNPNPTIEVRTIEVRTLRERTCSISIF